MVKSNSISKIAKLFMNEGEIQPPKRQKRIRGDFRPKRGPGPVVRY
jgi:hypothetical protein